MKKILALLLAIMTVFSLTACGGSSNGTDETYTPEVIKNFDELDTSKFHGCINGDGDFLVMYEGDIDKAVMGADLMTADGASVKLSEATIVKNPDGNSLLFFEQVSVKSGDVVHLILEKEGYEKLTFDVTVEY